jgi:predicted phosphodiesterase
MQIIEKRLPADHDLILTSDWHLGTCMHESSGPSKVALELARNSKNAFCLHGGDAVEAIMVTDKRWNPDTDRKALPLQQYGEFENWLGCYQAQMIACMLGNHDWKLAATYGNYLQDVICKKLKIPYGTYTAKFHIKDKKGRTLYNLFYTHGAKSISSAADDPQRQYDNMRLMLKRRLKEKAGDCEVMAMGHTHRLFVLEPMQRLYLTDQGGKIKAAYTGAGTGEWIHPDFRWYVNSGCFMRLYREGVSGYAEMFGYDPFELGYAVIKCRGGKIENIERRVI